MQYFVHRGGSNLGPYSLAELQQQLAAGSIAPGDLAWHEGLPQWQAVSSLVSSASSSAAVLPVAPSAPLAATAASLGAPGSEDQVRQAYFGHEQQVRSLGTWYVFSGIFQMVLSVLLIVCGALSLALGGSTSQPSSAIIFLVEGFILLGLSVLTYWAGRELKSLGRHALVLGIVVSALSVLGFPVGTIVGAIFLYLLLCEKGRFVLSEPYRAVVAATPQYQWKTAIWVWILAGIVVLAIVSVVVISVLLALGQTVHQISSQTAQ